ncbi:M23 family metallopeptidase [Jongsikchunia kroppenstedtii]|uniref:M23 family metallopeptidase n=1 Tax=Jongsikchunia kroppenstedtii TaxID=1121721 RepID=UPI000364CF24|nr:M23 family metallopeptidase [Jongsikchunia kroppenstedtii]
MHLASRLLVATLVIAVVATGPASAAPAAPSPTTGADEPTRGRYGWPLWPKPQVTKGFSPPKQRWQPGHRGLDLAATAGQPVLAAGSGVVQFAGVVAGKPTVSIRHASGLLTTYEPVRASVRAGQAVSRGAPIGTVEPGHPGCAAVCLHWGARRGAGRTAAYVNPLSLVGALRLRLKPLQPGDAP